MSHSSTYTARDAKNRFGEMLDAARRAPVTITKNGREVAVMISREDYELFEKIDDAIWEQRARDAHEKGGYLTAEESAEYVNSVLNADTSAK